MAYVTDGEEPSLSTALQNRYKSDQSGRQISVIANMLNLRAGGLAPRAFGLETRQCGLVKTSLVLRL